MKSNLEKTTVRDLSRYINSSFLRAAADTSLDVLAEMLCASDRYKIYLEDKFGYLCGVIQAKHIAMEILKLSPPNDEAEEMLPAIAYVMNYHKAIELADKPVSVQMDFPLKKVLELMDRNSVREVAVVDDQNHLIGTLEAKHILAQYVNAKAEASY